MYQLRFYGCNVHKFKNLKIIKVYKFLQSYIYAYFVIILRVK